LACNCAPSALACCPDQEYVQDKVCSPWTGTVTDTDEDPVTIVVYDNNIGQSLSATGYLQYASGPADISLQPVDSSGNDIGAPIVISPGTTTSFTFRRFAQLQVILPASDEGANDGVYSGELCITVRYPLP